MSFPFLPLSLALVVGILAATSLHLSLFLSVLCLLIFLFLAWLFFLQRRLQLCLIAALCGFVFFGSSHYLLQNHSFESNPLRSLPSDDYLDLWGKLQKAPVLTTDRLQLFLSVSQVRFKGVEKKVGGTVQVSFPLPAEGTRPELFASDQVKVSARLLRDDEFSNFSPPVSRLILKSRKIHRRAYAKSFLLLEKIEGAGKFSWRREISSLHRALQKNIERYFLAQGKSISDEGAFLEALLLGDRGRLDAATTMALQSSGLFHLIAISGAHIAIISFFLFHLLRLFRLPPNARSLIIILTLIFYALLVEGRPSVLRATIMTIFYLLSRLLWKDTHLLNTIAASCFLLLLLNPFRLFDTGFILTFMATLTIILFFPRIKRVLPLLPLRLTDLTVLSISAQLGVMPFIARSFNRITMGSIILNLAAGPLIGLIMAAGWIFLFLSTISQAAGEIFALGVKYLIRLFFLLTHLLDGITIFSYRIPTPPLWVIAGYFFFLFLLLSPRRFRLQRWGLGLAWTAFFLLLLLHPFPSRVDHLRVTFLDVGQGESILVEFPGTKKMLIDGGGLQDDSFDIGEYVVSPFLWRRGIKRIDYVVLTHAHPDHLNGLRAVARNFQIKEFWEAVIPDKSPAYEKLKALLSLPTSSRQLFRHDQESIAGFRVEVLHPLPRTSSPTLVSNEESMVLRLTDGRRSLLLTADIGQESERDILEAGLEVQAEILKSPHHGSRTSSSDLFLQRVRPRAVIISVGSGNVYGVPHPEILERYQRVGAIVLRTDIDGAVEVTFLDRKLRFRTSRTRLDMALNLD